MKKILILTSIKTGSGHRSASNAIEKKLKEKGYETRQIDVFPLMGPMGLLMEDSYIPLTTKAPLVYYFCQRWSEYFPSFIHHHMYRMIRKKLLEVIGEYQPDLIISVQCMFTQAISRLIRKNDLQIPFDVGVVDLVEPPSVWFDKDADMTFVPTDTIREDYLKKGFPPEKILVSGFPVRDDIVVRRRCKIVGKTVHILMINASTDLRKNIALIKETSRLENVAIDYVCGLDESLYHELIRLQMNKQLPDGIRIYSFIDNIHEKLAESHIILTKAGPNMIMEALRSDTAVVITGHIKGQEDHNYRYVVENGFGLQCEDPDQIYDTLRDFIHSGRLQDCLQHISDSHFRNGTELIAACVKEQIGS